MKISRGCISLIIVILFLSLSCTTVPITGRQQFSILPDYAMLSMSLQQYNEFLKTNKISRNQEQTKMVKKVGRKIQMAVEQYFTDKNMSHALKDYKWEFNLIESEEKNAWAMPGGKVVVYEGILPITKDEAGLAVVMGHEIAHAIAKHGNERMSQGLIAQIGGMTLSKALAEKPEKTRQLWMTVFGVGAQYGVMLPFSRLQESEADHLGLIFMDIAGYNPDEAVEVWKRMAQLKEGQAPPEFLSTHPSDETRIRKIKETIPKAKQYL
ncbi:MAG: Beta-barrel assembly-enhancing protease [Candidatus Scalindua arabica]|uniref:Beta-barrel assembly-enhancing protease n=1 Tax=Candidatus Scalindua arabica TaxID=1127984 RepID=A0A942A1Q9_9BACT|nr:Beta-barrel assembly-enhancing protease [Candidatus Scalindua arabica]